MQSPIRVIQFGLGPIGQACARDILAKQHTKLIQLVGAVDNNPALTGRDIASLWQSADVGIEIVPDLSAALAKCEADVVLHTTSSFLDRVSEQVLACVSSGLHVVSSTEELSYPFGRYPELSRRLDAAAQANGVAIVGTGVNPGFVMDALALVTTAVASEVRSVRVTRIVDAGLRRLPLQKKVGAGLAANEFEERRASGGFGHIGLEESARMIAAGLGWGVESLSETLQPRLAERDVEAGIGNISAGRVLGIQQVATLLAAGGRRVELELQMYVGAENPSDTIQIEADRPVQLTISGGVFGDSATVSMLVNTLPRIIDARPGLRSMLDLALPRAFATAIPYPVSAGV